MRRINKAPEPEFWIEFKRKYPNVTYKELSKTDGGEEIRRKIREYILKSQYHLCAYCCKQISLDESLNEHIEPEEKYPNHTMNYENLIVSCKESETCGSLKDNKYDCDLFVSPLDADCENYFSYSPNGEIHTNDEKGAYTVNLLGLNSYALQQARAAKYKAYSWCDEEAIEWYLKPHDEKLEPFVDILEYFYRQGFYSGDEFKTK